MESDEKTSEPNGPDPLPLKDPNALRAYKGKVVAVVDGEVRASADTWGECVRAIRKLGIDVESAIFTSVPRARFVG